MAEKVFTKHVGKEIFAREITVSSVDFVMAQDGTAPLAIKSFNEMESKRVFDPRKIAFVIDHNSPSPSEAISALHKLMRDFASEQGIEIFDVGEGICHQLIPEKGHVRPGDLIVGADSHTCTYGALNALATGVGSTDLAAAMMTGQLWFKVPETIRININGKFNNMVFAKDLILFLIGKLGADGATYMSLEFGGDLSALSMDGRFTVANMAIEAGAKFGIFEGDELTARWIGMEGYDKEAFIFPDEGANYFGRISIDLGEIEPLVALPHRVDTVSRISDIGKVKVNQVFIGTCTNGRLEDLKVAASMLKGRKVARGVMLIVGPASRKTLLDAIEAGYISDLIEAGASVITPGCGPCVGTHGGIPSDGDVVVSTANRNFKGRMGNSKAMIYLSSPATAAASAVSGYIMDPREMSS
ncbi:MAG: 3-isopropylmalate dehydratase large subunit [Actinobacteria bacterium]|nr:3-isopropylmalate dehydratase large subunit [Actinomycetota bacterium]